MSPGPAWFNCTALAMLQTPFNIRAPKRQFLSPGTGSRDIQFRLRNQRRRYDPTSDFAGYMDDSEIGTRVYNRECVEP
jgi:hypothetical protein